MTFDYLQMYKKERKELEKFKADREKMEELLGGILVNANERYQREWTDQRPPGSQGQWNL